MHLSMSSMAFPVIGFWYEMCVDFGEESVQSCRFITDVLCSHQNLPVVCQFLSFGDNNFAYAFILRCLQILIALITDQCLAITWLREDPFVLEGTVKTFCYGAWQQWQRISDPFFKFLFRVLWFSDEQFPFALHRPSKRHMTEVSAVAAFYLL